VSVEVIRAGVLPGVVVEEETDRKEELGQAGWLVPT
jgi:hypothetical protein